MLALCYKAMRYCKKSWTSIIVRGRKWKRERQFQQTFMKSMIAAKRLHITAPKSYSRSRIITHTCTLMYTRRMWLYCACMKHGKTWIVTSWFKKKSSLFLVRQYMNHLPELWANIWRQPVAVVRTLLLVKRSGKRQSQHAWYARITEQKAPLLRFVRFCTYIRGISYFKFIVFLRLFINTLPSNTV